MTATPEAVVGLAGIGLTAVTAAVAVLSGRIQRVHTVVDGTPPGPPPFTHITETDESWLSELPAVDTNYRTAQAARRAWNQGRK